MNTRMRIGPIQLASPFCQAGLAGYSDRAMRVVARRRGCPYAVTEALLDVILLNGGEGLRKSIDINDEDHPVAGQIIGSEPESMAGAARMLASRGYDVVDLNFACPVKKIKNKARGGHMLKDVPRGLSILRAVRGAVPAHVPTTVSLRRAFDDAPESEDRFYAIVDEAWALGYSAVRVHARTVEQKYAGPAVWPVLREVKSHYPDRTILGSGDVFTAEDAVRMLYETGVDLVWVARGAIGNPWIFRHAAMLLSAIPKSPLQAHDSTTTSSRHASPLQLRDFVGATHASPPQRQDAPVRATHGSPLQAPTIGEQREALTEHFAIAMEIHGEQLAGRRMRKTGIKYSRFHPDAPAVKTDFIAVHSLRDWNNVLDRWYAHDAPGVWPDPRAADEVNAGAAQTCEEVAT
jgi:tRNA-dihydrouridine synthase